MKITKGIIILLITLILLFSEACYAESIEKNKETESIENVTVDFSNNVKANEVMTKYEVMSIVASSFSLLVSIIALLFSKKDKPSFMPDNNKYNIYLNKKIITLSWINASDKTINDLTILINFYNSNLDEIKIKKIEDKYNFGIAGQYMFNYSFEDMTDLKFFRVRFHGKYSNIFPFIKSNLYQYIWYTANPIIDNNSVIVEYDFQTTFKSELKQIQDNNKQILKEYENTIDNKFR